MQETALSKVLKDVEDALIDLRAKDASPEKRTTTLIDRLIKARIAEHGFSSHGLYQEEIEKIATKAASLAAEKVAKEWIAKTRLSIEAAIEEHENSGYHTQAPTVWKQQPARGDPAPLDIPAPQAPKAEKAKTFMCSSCSETLPILKMATGSRNDSTGLCGRCKSKRTYKNSWISHRDIIIATLKANGPLSTMELNQKTNLDFASSYMSSICTYGEQLGELHKEWDGLRSLWSLPSKTCPKCGATVQGLENSGFCKECDSEYQAFQQMKAKWEAHAQ